VFRRFLVLTRKDLTLLWRNHFTTALLVVTALYALVIHFFIPADVSAEPDVVLFDATESQVVAQFYRQGAEDQGTAEKLIFVDSAAAYRQALEESTNRVGLHVTGQAAPERITLTWQGYENSRVRRLTEAALRQEIAEQAGIPLPAFETEELSQGRVAERPPFNLTFVPLFVFMDAGLVGLYLAAALLYFEKGEGSLRAYRVTPGSATSYLLAKSVAMALLGTGFTVMLTLVTVGLGANWAAILPVIFLGSLVLTLVIMVVANMFQTINQFLFSGLLFTIILSLPLFSYFAPSISFAFFRVLPTYPMIFALREAYFPTGNSIVIGQALQQLGITFIIALPLCAWTFRRQLIARDA